MEVARDFLRSGALPDRGFVSSDAFLLCGGGGDVARWGEEEERLTSLVAVQRLRVHPIPIFCFAHEMTDSGEGN